MTRNKDRKGEQASRSSYRRVLTLYEKEAAAKKVEKASQKEA
jgi:hypothetical protein